MRIVGGSARGRTLQGPGPRARGIRPTADRVRESLFNILGQTLEGGEVLDLYAGTGALSLEALSRGADRAVQVDSSREALALCRANAEALGFSSRVQLLGMSAARAVEKLGWEGRRFALAFADPPYAQEAAADILGWFGTFVLLSPGGLLLLEHGRREQVPQASGLLRLEDQRPFGDTRVSFFRAP